MELKEREFIRDLAKKKLEMANSPRQQELAQLWAKHNDGESERPMVHFEMGTVGDTGFNYACQCTSPDAREVEMALGRSIQNQIMVGDDSCITPDFYVSNGGSFKLFGLDANITHTGIVGYHINAVIENLDTLEQIRPSHMVFDEEGVKRGMEYYGDLFGDILEVKPGMNGFHCCPNNQLLHLMTMENMFTEMYDNPDNFKIMMCYLQSDQLRKQ